MADKSRWSLEAEYTFACYTCGLRKYGEGVIYGLIMDMRHEWSKTSKDREAEKARKAEEDAQKAKIKETIARYHAEQRLRDAEAKRRAEEEERRKHREWLEQTRTAQAMRMSVNAPPEPSRSPPKVDSEPVVEAPASDPYAGMTPVERRRAVQAVYREANRELLREKDRARREQARVAREALKAPVVKPAQQEVGLTVDETPQEQRKRMKRERDARYRAAKRARQGKDKPEMLPPPPPVIIVPDIDQMAATSFVGCMWHGCPNEARIGSKYCSRNCSNKNARARERERRSA